MFISTTASYTPCTMPQTSLWSQVVFLLHSLFFFSSSDMRAIDAPLLHCRIGFVWSNAIHTSHYRLDGWLYRCTDVYERVQRLSLALNIIQNIQDPFSVDKMIFICLFFFLINEIKIVQFPQHNTERNNMCDLFYIKINKHKALSFFLEQRYVCLSYENNMFYHF